MATKNEVPSGTTKRAKSKRKHNMVYERMCEQIILPTTLQIARESAAEEKVMLSTDFNSQILKLSKRNAIWKFVSHGRIHYFSAVSQCAHPRHTQALGAIHGLRPNKFTNEKYTRSTVLFSDSLDIFSRQKKSCLLGHTR